MSVAMGNMAAPADEAAAVTPSDTVDIPLANVRALYVGTAGDVTVNMKLTGSTILFKAVPAGAWLPIRVTRVLSTGTGASNIVALA